MDIKAAHNNALIKILIEILKEMNIPKLMQILIYNVTSGRQFSIKFVKLSGSEELLVACLEKVC
jgi:hypothetical protein